MGSRARLGASQVLWSNPLLSDWLFGGQYLHDRAALIDYPLREGRVTTYRFQTLFPGQARATIKLYLTPFILVRHFVYDVMMWDHVFRPSAGYFVLITMDCISHIHVI